MSGELIERFITFAARWRAGQGRNEIVYSFIDRSGFHQITVDDLEEAAAAITAAQAEVENLKRERDGARKALDYLMGDPAVPAVALERTRQLMQHWEPRT